MKFISTSLLNLTIRSWFPALLLCLSLAAQAQVKVESAWARATVPGQQSTGVFMQLTADQALKLVGVESTSAKLAELHTMTMDNHVMKMRPVASIDLPAKQMVALQPGGFHIMLIDVKATIKSGEKLPLTLLLEDAAMQRIRVPVQALVRDLTANH